ncbi:hypothetical protein V8C86DRAFT_1436791 [Haematococcus lacustris]
MCVLRRRTDHACYLLAVGVSLAVATWGQALRGRILTSILALQAPPFSAQVISCRIFCLPEGFVRLLVQYSNHVLVCPGVLVPSASSRT